MILAGDIGRGEEPVWLTDELRQGNPPAAIGRAALAAKSESATAALRLFVSIYGAEAGNLALRTYATGGVFVAGGIAPTLLAAIKDGTLLASFVDKGRMQDLLRAIPVRVVTSNKVNLVGAAHCARLARLGPAKERGMAIGHSVHVSPSRQHLARAAARVFVERGREAVRQRGRFTVALAGGSTPQALYRVLADEAKLREAGTWPEVHVYWGDERHVPPTHDESNFRMAREALLDRVPIPQHQIHRIEAEGPDATRVALAYEQAIRGTFGLADGEWPSFDLVLLGMGEDGHTASLFPGSPAVRETARLVVAPFVERFGAYRITMTPPVFAQAREIGVLVAGADKAHTLREVLEGPYDPDRYPIQCLRESTASVTWFVDAAAASLLTPAAGPI